MWAYSRCCIKGAQKLIFCLCVVTPPENSMITDMIAQLVILHE